MWLRPGMTGVVMPWDDGGLCFLDPVVKPRDDVVFVITSASAVILSRLSRDYLVLPCQEEMTNKVVGALSLPGNNNKVWRETTNSLRR